MRLSEIDFGKFKAAMFDYDGTLTERGVWVVDDEIAGRMGELLRVGFPIAVCTGRQLNSFAGRFRVTFDYIREKFGDEAARNLYLLAENGAVGYEFDFSASGASGASDTSDAKAENCWKMFYMAEWPKEVPKKDFETRLYALLKDKVEILTHHVPIVLAPLGRREMDIDTLNKASAEVFEIASDFMKSYGVGTAAGAGAGKTAMDFLHIGDSGLGCLICPAEGDKDSAIRVFWEFLKERGVTFSEKSVADGGACREIMVAGDSPQKSGNDHYFLNGRYGTAFSVGGDSEPGSEWPVVVVDEQGKRLLNSKGVLYLLDKLPL